MIIKQADLFYGLNHNVIKDIVTVATRTSFSSGEVIFRAGEPANRFYILVKGCVRLSRDHAEHDVFTSCRVGEIFGWSSLIGRQCYSASAECMESATLLRFDRQPFLSILEKDIFSGFVFFKQLAAALGNRLINLYEREAPTVTTTSSSSAGAAT
jgi:CRP-like cAMP-binding protein